jgi:hypothetical protein
MKWSDLPLNPTSRVLRQFAAAWLVFFLGAALHQALVRHHPGAGRVLGGIALIGVIGLLKPATVRWLFVVATMAAFPIGWVVTQVMLALMFYLILTPVALIFRWRGRDELQLRRKPGQSGFWITRDPPPDAGRYLKQF